MKNPLESRWPNEIVKILLGVFLLSACAQRQVDPAQAGQEYCSCMKIYGAANDYLLAYKICDAEMLKKYRYYRINKFYVMNRQYSHSISNQAKDSARVYMGEFADYIAENCCKESRSCKGR